MQLDHSSSFSSGRRPAICLAIAVLAAFVACGALAHAIAAQDELPALVNPDGSDSDAATQDPSTDPQPGAGAGSPFADALQKARDDFKPISDEQLSAARSELDQRIGALERFVGPSSTNGQKWLKYLRWDGLQESLAADGLPKLEPLAETYRQLNKDENGLDLPPFRRLSDALRQYLDLVAVAQLKDPAAAYGQQLDALATDLERYRENPTSRLELAIGNRLDFLVGVGQADDLVYAVRGELSRPNAYVQFSEGLLGAAAGEPIDRSEQVTDVILGTCFRGTANTIGSVSVRTVPSADTAKLELLSDGRAVANNTGRNGPAVICTTSYTDFNGVKTVELDDDAFRTHRAWVNARTTSDIHSVSKAGGGLGSRIVARVGMQQAREKQGQSNAIAADHAEDRIARRMNDEVGREVRDARRRYEEEYRRPLARRGELPPYIRFSTTDDAMRIVATQANRSQLGAPSEPPALVPGRDLVARLHATAINNYVAIVLSGATVSETEPGQDAKFDVELPDWMRDAWEERKTEPEEAAAAEGEVGEEGDANPDDAESFEPYSLTFRRGRPITVEFNDGNVKLMIHVARLISGEDEFENWDISGTFSPELRDGGVVLHREGDLEVLPTGFDPERGQLSSRQVGVRSNLTKVLNERSGEGRGFPRTIEIDRIEPEDDYAEVGPVDLEEFASGDGWLTLAWDRASR